ncbi:MAG: branched-chain amino acid ABC transporter permease [Caldilineae bacterium]|nr:MAG: branched-chain amino acid ABC transporter permease [Caldilineae bacterium]
MLYELVQSTVSGLLIGAAFAVLSVGFSLTWGVTQVLNIAHAAFALLAAYLGYFASSYFQVDPVLVLVVIVPLFFVLGVGIHQVLIKITAQRAHDLALSSMILTFGLAVVMENVMQVLWTPDPRVLKTSYTGKAIFVGPIAIATTHLISFVLAMLTIALLYVFVHHTLTGKAVRAVWQNPTGAALSGVNMGRVTNITYGIAVATAGIGGVVMSLIYTFDPSTDMVWLVYIFLVVILGGVGSVLGALLAGLIIGLTVGISGVFIPLVWVNLVLFLALILLLLLRPSGLLQR